MQIKYQKNMRIKRKIDTEANRNFWASFPEENEGHTKLVLPFLGDPWWEIEKELSASLLKGCTNGNI